MFKLVHNNKKGLTLVELLVTIVIFGLLISLAGMILYQLTNNYNNTATRWKVQNAVRLACSKFENNANYIVNSKEIDIFKEEALDEGIIYDSDTGNWVWQKTPTLITTEADDYTYIFSVKAYEAPDGWSGTSAVSDTSTLTYLGYFLFIKYDSDTTVTGTNSNYPSCVLFLNSEGFGEVPVQVEFSVGTNYLPSATTTTTTTEASTETTAKTTATESYMSNSVKVDFKSGNTDSTPYSTETKYVSENLAASKTIGMKNGQLIYDASWKVDDSTMSVYPCGWTDTTISGCPSGDDLNVKVANADGTTSVAYTYTAAQISETGNVLRFISPLSDKTFEEGSGSSVTEMPSCLSDWTFSDSINAESYLNNLRDFRDNVLRGTEFGDWFIHQYYYVWSPFLIEHTAFLKPVYQAILVPLSYICGFFANL